MHFSELFIFLFTTNLKKNCLLYHISTRKKPHILLSFLKNMPLRKKSGSFRSMEHRFARTNATAILGVLAFSRSHSCCSNNAKSFLFHLPAVHGKILFFKNYPIICKLRICENSVNFTELYGEHITHWNVQTNDRFYRTVQ